MSEKMKLRGKTARKLPLIRFYINVLNNHSEASVCLFRYDIKAHLQQHHDNVETYQQQSGNRALIKQGELWEAFK
jgi:hypothetical protein